MATRGQIKFAFQNIDGDGTPTQGGDVVGLVESPQDMSLIKKWSLPRHDFYRAQMNYRVTAFVKDSKFKVEKAKSVLVHPASRFPPSPRRTWLVLDGELEGWATRVLLGHAINSAWAPKWKFTTFRNRRRRKWERWYDVGQRLVDEAHNDGRLVIMMVDGNRSRDQWTFRGLKNVISHGPDEVFISKNHKSEPQVEDHKIGPKTGNGRVTHPSIGYVLSLLRRGVS